jgi:hypothetical protein
MYFPVDLWKIRPDVAVSCFGPIATWDTSQVRTMKDLFAGMNKFNEDITTWDVSHVEDMTGLFANASSFNQPIGCWDISKVRNTSYMFRGTLAFNQSLTNWHDHQFIYRENMFDHYIPKDVLGEIDWGTHASDRSYYSHRIKFHLLAKNGKKTLIECLEIDPIAFVKQQLYLLYFNNKNRM